MRTATLASIGLFVLSAISWGQQTRSTGSDVAASVEKLNSQEWTDRAQAYERLGADQAVIRNDGVKAALIDLLDRENSLVESTLRESHEQIGASGKYGEGYGEYFSKLLGTVSSIANWKDPRQLCILVHSSYSPESVFASKLAAQGRRAVPCLTRMYGSDVGLTRAKAAAVLVQVSTKRNLDSVTSQSVWQILTLALHDPNEAVRSNTVHALGRFGGENVIPLLREVANTDPSPEVQGSSIRKTATKAIAAIEKRADQK